MNIIFDDSMDRRFYNCLVTGKGEQLIWNYGIYIQKSINNFANKAYVYRTRSPECSTKSMPSPPSRLKFVPNTVSVFQRFVVAMFQPVWADLPVADRQPTCAKGTQIVSTLPNIRQIAFYQKSFGSVDFFGLIQCFERN